MTIVPVFLQADPFLRCFFYNLDVNKSIRKGRKRETNSEKREKQSTVILVDHFVYCTHAIRVTSSVCPEKLTTKITYSTVNWNVK